MAKAPTLARSSAVMFMGTLASRMLGLVRNAMLVAALGATGSGAADAFTVANNAPTMIYNLLAAGVLNAILVPQIVRALRQKAGEEFINRLITTAGALLAVVTGVLTVAATIVVTIYGSQLGQWHGLATAFAYWCLPQIFFYGLYALWGQVLNAKNNFGPYMWAPVLNNIISIVSLAAYLFIYGEYSGGGSPANWDFTRTAVIAGTSTLGIAIQALVLYIPLVRTGFKPRLVWGLRGSGLGQVSKVALWAVFGLIVVELSTLVVYNLGTAALSASELPEYAHTVVPSTVIYTNAQMIFMLPQSLVTTSIIVALFTRMSEKAAAGDAEGVKDDLSLGLRTIAIFTTLFSAGIFVLAGPAMQVFVPTLRPEEVSASAAVLMMLAIGIVPQGLWATMQRVMLAYNDTKRMLWADVPVGLSQIIICALAYIFAPATWWMILAALGSAASQATGSIIIVFLLRKHLPHMDVRRVSTTYALLGLAVAPAVVAGYLVRYGLNLIHINSGFSDSLAQILIVAPIMTLVYLLTARALRVEELNNIARPVTSVVRKVASLLPAPIAKVLNKGAAALVTPPAYKSESVPLKYSDVIAEGEVIHAAATDVVSDQATGKVTVAESTPATLAAAKDATAAARDAVDDAAAEGATGDLAKGATSTSVSDTSKTSSSASKSLGTIANAAPAAAIPPIPPPPASSGADTPAPSIPMQPEAENLVQSFPIGSGRYHLCGNLPTSLPHVRRYHGIDTILDQPVAIYVLTEAVRNQVEVLESAQRAALATDPRLVRVRDVELEPAFIVTDPVEGVSFDRLIEDGLEVEQARSVIGEVASALDNASRRGLHHLCLSTEDIRVTADGKVRVFGLSYESALRHVKIDRDEHGLLAYDITDAKALLDLLYYGLTKRWPGKRTGIPSAPLTGGHPVSPATINPQVPADLDEIFAQQYSGRPIRSAAALVTALGTWQPVKGSQLPVAQPTEFTTKQLEEGVEGLEAVKGLIKNTRIKTTQLASRVGNSVREDIKAASDAIPAAPGPGREVDLSDLSDIISMPTMPATKEALDAPRPMPSKEENEAEYIQYKERSRTSWALLAALALVVILAVVFAFSNLLGLSNVSFDEDDGPAASTVPTVTSTQGQ